VGAQELEEYHQQFERIKADARELTDGLTEAQFNWRPAPDQWSIEECLSHLTMIGHVEMPAIERAVDEARAQGITGSSQPQRFGPIERFLIGLAEPPVKRKLPAPKRFTPLHGQPLTAVIPTFLHVQSQFQHQIDRAAGLDLARVKVVTPVASWLKMSLGGIFAHTIAHERRHIEQARRVRVKLPS
jgi:hypothetical protein